MEARPPSPGATLGNELEHLRLLSIFHYVLAGILGLVSLLPGIPLMLGLLLASGRLAPEDDASRIVGSILAGCAGFFMLAGLTFATLVAQTGRSLAERRRYTFCLVIAGILCVVAPLGTLVGVFTIIVLASDSVRALFDADSVPAAAAARR